MVASILISSTEETGVYRGRRWGCGQREGERPPKLETVKHRRLHNGVGWIRHFKNKHS